MRLPFDEVATIARQLRVDAIRASAAAGSGHPTSSMSAADLMAVLVAEHLRYDFDAPERPENDHMLFSKGHATPLLYAVYKAVGAIDDDELLTYRSRGSHLEGHPTPALPWVPAATGSLGQGLPIGVGTAIAAARLDRLDARTWVLCGDSEMSEGSMWEAFEYAAQNALDNLIAIIDVNRLGQRGETMHGWDLGAFSRRATAFGWRALEVDGHDLSAIDEAYGEAMCTRGQPTVVIARTVKGSGVPDVENRDGFHGKPLPDPQAAISLLGGVSTRRINVARPEPAGEAHRFGTTGRLMPRYELGEKVATRAAFGASIVALADQRGDVVVLDAEVSNSTMTADFREAHPERFFEVYIAEQQMVAAAIGMQARGWLPFVSSFAAFLLRAYDFVKMAAVSQAELCLVGSHVGVSIGPDGPSQMGLEDIAAFRAVHGAQILYSCDANQTASLTSAMAEARGIRYLRTTRGATPVIYGADERFEIGGSRVLRSSASDEVTLVAAGITVHEALAAAEQLASEGLSARVVDAYSVQPLDVETLLAAADATGGRIVTIEDHREAGGLGEAVTAALSEAASPPRVRRLAVRHMPASASPEEQLDLAGLSASHIATAARDMAR